MKSGIRFVKGARFSMPYNVQPLRSQQEINDFLFCLRRNKNAERDVFLFLIGINSGLRMSDIVPSKQGGDLLEHLVHRIDFQMAAFGARKQIICRFQVYGVRLDQVLQAA